MGRGRLYSFLKETLVEAFLFTFHETGDHTHGIILPFILMLCPVFHRLPVWPGLRWRDWCTVISRKMRLRMFWRTFRRLVNVWSLHATIKNQDEVQYALPRRVCSHKPCATRKCILINLTPSRVTIHDSESSPPDFLLRLQF